MHSYTVEWPRRVKVGVARLSIKRDDLPCKESAGNLTYQGLQLVGYSSLNQGPTYRATIWLHCITFSDTRKAGLVYAFATVNASH